MAYPGSRRGPHQVAGRLVVALGSAREVHDDLRTVYRGLGPLVLEQVTGHVVDAVGGFVDPPLSTRTLPPASSRSGTTRRPSVPIAPR